MIQAVDNKHEHQQGNYIVDTPKSLQDKEENKKAEKQLAEDFLNKWE